MDKIRVVIADDHAIVREGLTKLIELEDDLEVVGVAENGTEAIDFCKSEKPDVLLLDINMPKMNGVEVLRRMEKKHMDTKVLMLTIHDQKSYVVESISYGVYGYMLKDADSDLLFEAIRQVSKGETFIYPDMQKHVDKRTVRKIRSGKADVTDHLTPREVEVLLLIAEGQNNKNISENLYISEKTVKNHISSIFRKLGVSDRTSAALYCIREGVKKF